MRMTPVPTIRHFSPRFSSQSADTQASQPDASIHALPAVLSQDFGNGVYGQEIFVNAAFAIQDAESKSGTPQEISLSKFVNSLAFLRARIVKHLISTEAGSTQPETYFYPTETKGHGSFTFPAFPVPQRSLTLMEKEIIRTRGEKLNEFIISAVNGLVEAGLLNKRSQHILGDKLSLTPNGRLVLQQIMDNALAAAKAAQLKHDN